MTGVREPAVAGKFYPDDPEELKRMINGYLNEASVTEIKGTLKGLIVPHAGYVYSGPVAAYGYKLLEGKNPGRIIILGPSHYAQFPGLAESGHKGWSTPLDITETFSIGNISKYPAAHRSEHSLEVQLPFLQVVLEDKEFTVDPILTGMISPEEGAAILEKEDAFLIVSSDLSHYNPYDAAKELDARTVELIERMDIPGFIQFGDACGKMGILIAIELAKRKGWKIKALHYANSGDTAGPRTEVVGYAALAIVEE